MKLFWFTDAIADLDEIYDYYFALNPRAAAMLYNTILDAADILRTHPRIAPIEPLLEGFTEEYRSLIVAKGKYKLVYYIDNDNVYIVLVFACRRNPNKIISSTLKRK